MVKARSKVRIGGALPVVCAALLLATAWGDGEDYVGENERLLAVYNRMRSDVRAL
jgi:hypothetical protein